MPLKGEDGSEASGVSGDEAEYGIAEELGVDPETARRQREEQLARVRSVCWGVSKLCRVPWLVLGGPEAVLVAYGVRVYLWGRNMFLGGFVPPLRLPFMLTICRQDG